MVYIANNIIFRDCCNGGPYGCTKCFRRPRLRIPNVVLDLRKCLLNWVKLGRIGRQINKRHLVLLQETHNGLGAMHGVVVHDQHPAAGQERQDEHLQIGDEALRRQRAGVQVGRLDPVLGEHRRRADGFAGRGGVFVVGALALAGAPMGQV